MNKNPHISLLYGMIALALLCSTATHAERADRDKPVNIEADRVTVDDKNKVQVFEGRVKLTQGTLTILSDKVVVSQDLDGFQKGIATGGKGGLAHFRQKRDGKNEYIDGEAERIEYDARSDSAQLFNRAKVQSGKDEAVGQYILYNGYDETYLITNGPNATVLPGNDKRATVVIQPRKNTANDTPKASASDTR